MTSRARRPSTCGWLTLLLLTGPLGGVAAAGEAGPYAPAPGFVLVEGDRLTVQLDRVPLPLVLAQIARQAGLQVSGVDAAADVVVSASFRELPMAEGIQRLLAAEPHVLAYARAPAAPGVPARWRISEVILLSKAKPPAGDAPAGDPGVPALADPNPQVRIQALETWVEQHQGDAVDPLTYALVDPDEQVRARAQELWERLLEAQAVTTAPSPAPGADGR